MHCTWYSRVVLIRIFPDRGAENHKWASVSEAMAGQMTNAEDTMSNVFPPLPECPAAG